MTVKSQLHACVDALMAGARAAERAAELAAEREEEPDRRVPATLRACLDVVERLEHSSVDVTVMQVDIALGVLKQAAVELAARPVPNAVPGAMRNALDRLQRLRDELNA